MNYFDPLPLQLPVAQDREFELTPLTGLDFLKKMQVYDNRGEKSRSRDTSIFTLHEEGLFYSCENEDAMAFANNLSGKII